MIYEVTATDYVLNACGLVCLARPNKECQFFMSTSDEKCYLGKDLLKNGQNTYQISFSKKYFSGGLQLGPRTWLSSPYTQSGLISTMVNVSVLESFCCKKSPNQEIGLRRYSEYRTSEGSE